MLDDVGERLLGDPVEGEGHVGAEAPGRPGDVQGGVAVAGQPGQLLHQRRGILPEGPDRASGFLEAGAESWDWGGGFQDAYTSFPELAAIVNRDYVLAASWKRFKFFMRRDLVLRKRGA